VSIVEDGAEQVEHPAHQRHVGGAQGLNDDGWNRGATVLAGRLVHR
jgi:hypothetical protein